MNILEVLHLRMAGDDLDELEELVRRAAGSPGPSPSVTFFRHARVAGDLLIHLAWNESDHKDEPSELGLRLASFLRIHGLLEHSVWIRGGGHNGHTTTPASRTL